MAGMMQVPDDGTWRTQSFRQNMVSKIEEAITHCGAPTSKNAAEMENQVFSKANSKNEYLSFVARLIIHIKEMGTKPKIGPGGVQMGGPQGQQQQQGMMGQMNQMNMNQIGMGGQMNPQGMQQQPQQMGMQGGGMSHQQQQMNMNQQQGMMNMGQQGGNVMSMAPQTSGVMTMPQQQTIGMSMGQQGQGINMPPQTMGQQGMTQQTGGMGMGGQQQGGMNMPQQSGGGMGMNPQTSGMNMPQQQQNPQGNVQQSMQISQQQNQMINQNFMASQQGQMQQQLQNQQGMNTNVSGQMQPIMSQMNPNQMQQQLSNQQMQQQQQTMFQQQPNQQNPQGQMTNPQQIMASRAANAMSGMAQNRMMGPQNPMASPMSQMPRKAPPHRPMGQNAMGISRPEHGPNYAMNRVNYYGSNVTQVDGVTGMSNQFVGPGGPQMQRPGSAGGGQFMPPNSSPGMGMQMGPTPSPNPMVQQGQNQPGFVNSPQPPNMLHPSHGSPAGPGRPFSNQMVPSPNTNLNTPMPMAPTPSPRNANPEDLACMEKIKELKKYTDLLQRMIAKIGNEDMEKSSKMKKLLEILTNPNQRVSMDLLLKCEAALKKMEKQQHDTGGVMAPASQPMPTKDQISPFQQIQDAILTTLKNGSSSHTFLRTFRPTIEAITGQSAGGSDSPDEGDLGQTDDERFDEFPSVLARELKIMDNRFHIRVSHNKNKPIPVQLIASLTDPKLPMVPPLKIHISADYPDDSPTVIDLRREYGTTPLLSSVSEALKSRLLYLPEKFTVIELLNCWEMSVRQVSSPHQKIKKSPVKLKRLHPATGRIAGSFL